MCRQRESWGAEEAIDAGGHSQILAAWCAFVVDCEELADEGKMVEAEVPMVVEWPRAWEFERDWEYFQWIWSIIITGKKHHRPILERTKRLSPQLYRLRPRPARVGNKR
ncbi:unnamed protein product [Cuscuta europaea]|uniref:Uncharacterized protein n=1 Tax=Cuscuta europaea TaxID=41803 RepID=A0A9P0YLI0_CUSEU|nr:unnamed protein product [Cuscuta europaea]